MIVGVQLYSGNSAPNSGNNHHLRYKCVADTVTPCRLVYSFALLRWIVSGIETETGHLRFLG